MTPPLPIDDGQSGAIRRLDRLPLLLRMTCLASLVGGVALLILSIFQLGLVRINNESFTWGEVKAAGYFPFLIICGLVLVVAAVGIWLRRGWSPRPA